MATDWNEWFKHEHPPAMQKQWILNTTWTDCPVPVQEVVERLWNHKGLGNDSAIYKTSIDDLRELQDEGGEWEVWREDPAGWVEEPINVQVLIDYLVAQEISEKDPVWVHHWW